MVWLEEAARAKRTPNPNAIALATADADGNPTARIVLCKHLDNGGHLVFYTNRESRKGQQLAARPRAAAVFHFDAFERQARAEGRVTESPEAESDAYFASRPLVSRIAAWASAQSRPIESREAMLAAFSAARERLGVSEGQIRANDPQARVPRPAHWGGYRLWFERVELWTGGAGRLHDRAAWTRTVSDDGDEFGPWSSARLQP